MDHWKGIRDCNQQLVCTVRHGARLLSHVILQEPRFVATVTFSIVSRSGILKHSLAVDFELLSTVSERGALLLECGAAPRCHAVARTMYPVRIRMNCLDESIALSYEEGNI